LALLNNDDIEAVRLRWVASLLSGQLHLDQEGISMLSVDPLRKDNIRMLNEFQRKETSLRASPVRQPAQRAMYLSEIARMRMNGQSEQALNHLERTLANLGEEVWIQGRLVRALLNFDGGRTLTAINTVKELFSSAPRHPHVRAVLHQLASLGKAERPPSEPTKIRWVLEDETDWKQSWKQHNVAIPPMFDTVEFKQHAMKANAWSLMMSEKGVGHHASKKAYKALRDDALIGLFTHLTGLTITIGGMPVDLGLPAGIDLKSAKKNGLLDP
jgi:hypothetical protein